MRELKSFERTSREKEAAEKFGVCFLEVQYYDFLTGLRSLAEIGRFRVTGSRVRNVPLDFGIALMPESWLVQETKVFRNNSNLKNYLQEPEKRLPSCMFSLKQP